MRRGWKIALAIVVTLAVLLVINAIVLDSQTKPAEVTIDGGQILKLSGADLQVLDEGPTAVPPRRAGAPIVLLHCSPCSLHWWDRIAPLLARRHRVIRVDLLGHGGSEKPTSGYSMNEQAQLVGEALNRLGVEGAVVVGHSTGFDVATALAEQSSQLVDRLVDIDEATDNALLSFPFVARLGYVPVIGQAIWRLAPSFAIKDGYGIAFAPGFDISSGFPNPDQVVDDFRAMTFTSYNDSYDEQGRFVEQTPLDERVRSAAIPLLVIFGKEDQTWTDPVAAAEEYRSVPGARIALVPGAGHSPAVERPTRTAALIGEFADEVGDEAESPPRG